MKARSFFVFPVFGFVVSALILLLAFPAMAQTKRGDPSLPPSQQLRTKPWAKLSAGRSPGEYQISHAASGGVDTAWMRQYVSALVSSNDRASAVAVDANGNVYVTGESSHEGDIEFATIKYNSQGDILWVARYEGGATALAVDGGGNVYVTGVSYRSGRGGDYATIKYNANGDSLWVRRYNGPGNSSDEPSSLAIDASGNVYVVGWSYSSGTDVDYATIKYNSNGDSLWVRRYNGPGSGSDEPSSLAIDASGNVYVTGWSYGSGTDGDYATIKYNSNGDSLWVRRYNGPGNSYDGPSSLAIDVSGNVYVTGRSIGLGTSQDYATIKYNSNGDTLWVRRYNGPVNNHDCAISLAVDAIGNAYVTGWSDSSGKGYDYATIKYNTNGDILWERRYNGAGNGDDVPSFLAVDASGNVYVTGWSYGSGKGYDYATIKYNVNGDTLWIRRYTESGYGDDTPSFLAIDAGGNVYVTGSSHESTEFFYRSNYATVKYSTNGDTLWVRRYNGPAYSLDYAKSFEIDATGNVYVSGTSYLGEDIDGPYGGIWTTAKYSANGEFLWAKHFDAYDGSPGGRGDLPRSLVVDGEGHVYVTGSDGGILTIKYDLDGDTLWVRRFDGVATSSAVDHDGNLVVAGSSVGDFADFVTIKYNAAGDTVWVRRYDGNNNDYSRSLAVDVSGNVYVTGSSGPDYATIKYNAKGDSVWVRRHSVPENGSAYPTSVAVDDDGNVYVTGGEYYASDTHYEIATIKYNSTGERLWVRRQAVGYWPSSVVVDGGRNVYVAGSGGTQNIMIKYSSNGDSLWTMGYQRPWNDYQEAVPFAIDASGNVYVIESCGGESGPIKYSTDGKREWIAPASGPAVGIRFDAANNVYVAGTSFVVIKYVQIPTSVNNIEPDIPSQFALEQNYPNPFNPSTVISYQLPVSSRVSLKIFDLLGREVADLVNEIRSAGSYKAQWNAANMPSGVYFYRLQVGNHSAGSTSSLQAGSGRSFVETKKMLLVK